MRAKTATTSPRSTRYVLYADRKLRKLSLRRISVPAKKRTRQLRPNGKKRATRPRKSGTTWAAATPPALFVGLMCFVAAAAVIAIRRPLHPTAAVVASAADGSVRGEHDASAPAPNAPTAAKDDRKQAATTAAKAASLAAEKPLATATASPAESAKPTGSSAADPSSTEAAAASSPSAETPGHELASADSPAKATEVAAATPVTVTGCVARDGDNFWLTNTSGEGLPASRSWKSGFLKKRTATIELVHTASALKLGNYVGQRVTATGALKNRELQLHSLQRVASSCS